MCTLLAVVLALAAMSHAYRVPDYYKHWDYDAELRKSAEDPLTHWFVRDNNT